MAYAQWVSIHIENLNVQGELTIKNVSLDWGKFYKGSKDNEISTEEVEKLKIGQRQYETINACGREHSASGTEGSLDVYFGSTKVGRYYWDCPWGSKSNTSNWTTSSKDFIVDFSPGNLDSGAIGSASIEVFKK